MPVCKGKYSCGEDKPLEQFSKDKSTKCGHKHKCKGCINKYYEDNVERINSYAAKYYENNKELCKQKMGVYIKDNIEQVHSTQKKWEELNPHVRRAIGSRRRARKLNATPTWVNHKIIGEIYAKAVELNMHVDHIIPLQGELVSGLHVENNLQLLTQVANAQKGNTYHVS